MSYSTDAAVGAPPTFSPATGAEQLVDALQREGVGHVFGLPGTTIMDVIDALARSDTVRFVSVRHEQAAAHMADGFFRAGGHLAACLASRGPGAANMAIGVHNAYAESVPLLALVGQVPDAVAHREAFEELDVVSMFRPMVKWAVEVHDHARVGELVGRAARTAVAGRPRPVLASIPLDVLQAESDRPADSRPADGVRLPVPAAADIEEAAALLTGASRPVIVLGGGVLRPRWSEEIVALAGQLTAPVVTTWMRKNAFPNSHPLFAGALGYGSAPSADAAVAEADVLLALGCRFSEFTTQRWSLVSEETRIIQVDVDPHEIGAIYPPAVGLVGDGWATAGLLAEAVGGRPPDALRDQRAARAAELRARYEADRPLPPPGAGSGVASAHVVEALDAALRQRELILVQDAHSFGPWVSRHLEFDRPGSYHGAAGGSMGWGLPAALGVQLARPDARVVAVCGDGSFWMVAQELETAVREELPVVVVVTNNFSYGNTRDRQRIAHEARYHGVFYDNPDFAAFARLLGGHGERVERGEDLEAALARALDSGRPAVVDVIQDRHEGLPPDLAPPAAQ